MHGTMFVHLRKFVDDRYGEAAWRGIMMASGLGQRVYLPISTYPDTDMTAIISAASDATGQPVQALLESFGEHVGPHLLEMYRHLLKPEWRTLDVLQHTEETAHRAVRLEQRGATPPYLQAKRVDEQRIELRYKSPRRLCGVAKGIIKGLSRHFGERIMIAEPSCMHRGADHCQLIVSSSAHE